MRLSDVYSRKFIVRLNSLNVGANLDFSEEVHGFIDVECILKKLQFKVRFNNQMNVSGSLSKDIILINGSEKKERQRFAMAHDLGHAMQNLHCTNRDFNDCSADDVFANTFASQFLMPKPVVFLEVDTSIKEKSYDQRWLTGQNVENIISDVARKLKVSEMAMKYRMDNLKIFIPAKNK